MHVQLRHNLEGCCLGQLLVVVVNIGRQTSSVLMSYPKDAKYRMALPSQTENFRPFGNQQACKRRVSLHQVH